MSSMFDEFKEYEDMTKVQNIEGHEMYVYSHISHFFLKLA
jgi:hypothetical protein